MHRKILKISNSGKENLTMDNSGKGNLETDNSETEKSEKITFLGSGYLKRTILKKDNSGEQKSEKEEI